MPVPQADRHLLALHALRQRQIRTSFLHGRHRTWRDRRRIWPAVMIALALVALLVAGTSVVAAFQRQQQVEAEQKALSSFQAAALGPGNVANSPW